MVASTIDHLVAVTVFLGALLIFIGLFNQTIQTAVLYQEHRYIATKCSDLLDNMLLNPGYPVNWGQIDTMPTGFGLQDPEFTQYQLSPFTLMRLQSATGTPVNCSRGGGTYSNITMGFGNFLLVPYTKAINYSLAKGLLGINNTFGFQLTITPIMTVRVTETNPSNPLTLTVDATGLDFPLSNATISYSFLLVKPKGSGSPPSYSATYGRTYTNYKGEAQLSFQNVTATDVYALIVYANLGGLTGVGYRERVGDAHHYVLPLVTSFKDNQVMLVHSYDVHNYGPPSSTVFFNATFVLVSSDLTLREVPLDNSTGKVGKVNYGNGQDYSNLTIPTDNPGILIITYQSNNQYGVVLMPWGLSSMSFPVVFGGSPSNKEWVATDTRQVTIDGISYQAKLALWSLTGFQVVN
jgi:hypothetical protein